MKPITILTIPHQEQRYDTVGDYVESPSILTITVSEMKNWRYEALVAVHELVEKLLAKSNGIKDADIDAFDMAFERARLSGDDREPGDNPDAPYYDAHQFATLIERLLARELGVNWSEYDDTVLALSQR